MREVLIVKVKRTPIGKKGGILEEFLPEQLAAMVIEELTKDFPKELVEEVILGNVVGPGGNMGRLAALTAGLPLSIPGVTVDRQCGAGLEAIRYGASLIKSGLADCIIAGGVESATHSPYQKRAQFSPINIGDPDMGIAAENVAEAYGITREQQDEFAFKSYEKALLAREKKDFSEMIKIKGRDIDDEGVRGDVNYHRLIQRVKPIFKNNGTVTLGNSCGINDGAACVLMMEKNTAIQLGFQEGLRFIDGVATGVDPNLLGIGPVSAVKKLLQRTNCSLEEIDLIEFNEAFAAQVVASLKELDIPDEKVNVGGGGIALGHPYGASGAINVSRLFVELIRRQLRYGIATLGIGGGMGMACLFERVKL